MGFRSGFSRANCVEEIKNNMGQIEKEEKKQGLKRFYPRFEGNFMILPLCFELKEEFAPIP